MPGHRRKASSCVKIFEYDLHQSPQLRVLEAFMPQREDPVRPGANPASVSAAVVPIDSLGHNTRAASARLVQKTRGFAGRGYAHAVPK